MGRTVARLQGSYGCMRLTVVRSFGSYGCMCCTVARVVQLRGLYR